MSNFENLGCSVAQRSEFSNRKAAYSTTVNNYLKLLNIVQNRDEKTGPG